MFDLNSSKLRRYYGSFRDKDYIHVLLNGCHQWISEWMPVWQKRMHILVMKRNQKEVLDNTEFKRFLELQPKIHQLIQSFYYSEHGKLVNSDYASL